ncbi:MAG: fimbria/pilus outer membrane usher protein [Vibrio sp.]|uniref:fimbria/pilus outer membrane usher protein n=1 Tax=Vibrio sp. TaxID=678 RepID=UPI003A86BA92
MMSIYYVGVCMNRLAAFESKNKSYRKVLTMTVLALLLSCHLLAEDEVEFDSSFFHFGTSVDVSQFSRSDYIPPGVYMSSVFLNDVKLTDTALDIVEDINGKTIPCIEPSLVKLIQFDPKYVPESLLEEINADDGHCVNFADHFVTSNVEYLINSNKLNIQIPQLYLHRLTRGYVPPSEWDSGVGAVALSYSFNAYNNSSDTQSISGSFSTSIGLGDWYFLHDGYATWSSTNDDVNFTTNSAYFDKPIPEIKSRALVGYTNSRGHAFDSVPIIGFSLVNDNNMLPTGYRGYAPEIRGIANTNAKVVIYQNDRVIYEATVPPGNFLIDDLAPTGFSGSLQVVVYEADGKEQHFVVPFDGLAQNLRPGLYNYSASIGQYRNNSLLTKPLLLEGTYERGLNNFLTGYGGVRGNADYYALNAGAALGTLAGAFSFDITYSDSLFLDNYSGQSYEVKYSKSFNSIGNYISLGAYRYSTERYLDYKTAMVLYDTIQRGGVVDDVYRSKHRYALTVGQELPGLWGSLYFSGVREKYWNNDYYNDTFSLGYSNNFKYYSLGINASRYFNSEGKNNTSYSINLGVPLGHVSDYASTLNLSHQADDEGSHSQRASLSGYLNEDKTVTYSAAATRNQAKNRRHTSQYDASVYYAGSKANVAAYVSRSGSYSSQSVSISGGLVAHKGGITLTPQTGKTLALVEAKGAEGAKVSGYRNLTIDSNGYAVVGNLSPYQMNEIRLDPLGAKKDIEFDSTSQMVAPYRNAVALLKFNVRTGYPLLVYVEQSIPFGAAVYDADEKIIGNVGQGSQIFARVSEPQGAIKVSWEGQSCNLNYSLTDKQQESGRLVVIRSACH